MKIIAKYNKHLFDRKHHAELTFNISNYKHTMMLDELEEDTLYKLEITKVKSKRSIQSNRYMWSLLHALEEETKQEAMEWYMFALEETGALSTYLVAPKGSRETLLNSYRAVKAICKRMIINPETKKETEGIMYRCYEGSSKMNTKEMGMLIDKIIEYCSEHYIDWEVLNID